MHCASWRSSASQRPRLKGLEADGVDHRLPAREFVGHVFSGRVAGIRDGFESGIGQRLLEFRFCEGFSARLASQATGPKDPSVFQRLQIGDHIADLTRIELKLRHCRMACHEAFGQGFGEVLDRIFRM